MAQRTRRKRRDRLTEVTVTYDDCSRDDAHKTRQAASLRQRYGAGFQNFYYGCHGCIYFGVGVIEVRREANAGSGTPVHENVTGQEFAAHRLRIGHVDGDCASALLGIARSVDLPSLPVGELDQAGGLTLGFLADLFYANFPNYFQAGTRGFDGGDVRGSVHEAEGRVGVADGTGGEEKRIFVREPSGESRLQLLAEVGADVEIR